MATIAGAVLRSFSNLEASKQSQEYQKLETKGKEIRIAELFPREFREKTKRGYVSCYTRTTSLADISNPVEPYTALSYTWGDPEKKVPFYLDNKLVHVTENLSEALQNFEQNHSALRIWADAICINQNDETEKSHQVGMMAEIFQRASEVLVWLGPGNDGSEEAIEVLKQMGHKTLQLQQYYRQSNGYTGTMDCKKTMDKDALGIIWFKWFPNSIPSFDLGSVQKVFQRSWFRRVWVLQEAAVNRNVTFYCGKHAISKQALWAGARAIIALTNKMSTLSRAGINDPLLWQTLGGPNFIARRTLHLVASTERNFSLETLLTGITTNLGEWAYEASDPRDRIFAILGFSSDSTTLNIHSNYEKSCNAVYEEVAEAILNQSDTLDILYAVSGPKNLKAVPSWVPDWSVPIPSTFGPRQIGKFSASGRQSRSFPRFKSDKFGNRLLVLCGYRVGTVDTIMDQQWDPCWEMCSDYDSEIVGFTRSLHGFGRRHKTAYPSEAERSEALWRTPIADCDARFSIAEKSRPSASSRMKESFEALMDINQGYSERTKTSSKPYIHVMKLESARRRIFLSSGGYYGLGQETLQVGDAICLFFGGDSPFIIRDVGGSYYELIGEAYLHGIMQGEYLSTNPSAEEFILC